MGTFVSDMLKQVEKASGQEAPWGDVNPLVVIGMTEAILDLGLNEEQMHGWIRGAAKSLISQVHPDRNPDNISAERQRDIIQAFTFIESPENFSRALAHFKTLRAEDRRETRILGQALVSLRYQISGFESQLENLNIGKRKLAEETRAFVELKKSEPSLIPELRDTIENLRNTIELERRTAVETGKERTRWSTRALDAEDKITRLEKKLREITYEVTDLDGKIRVLEESLESERKSKKWLEDTLLSLEKVVRRRIKKDKWKLPKYLAPRITELKNSIERKRESERELRKAKKEERKKRLIKVDNVSIQHPDVLSQE